MNTNETKHTPGPWEAKEFESGHIVIRCKHSPLLIAEMSQKLAPFKAEQKANAALIAAAPELLEALELEASYRYDMGIAELNRRRNITCAAIAKAKKGN